MFLPCTLISSTPSTNKWFQSEINQTINASSDLSKLITKQSLHTTGLDCCTRPPLPHECALWALFVAQLVDNKTSGTALLMLFLFIIKCSSSSSSSSSVYFLGSKFVIQLLIFSSTTWETIKYFYIEFCLKRVFFCFQFFVFFSFFPSQLFCVVLCVCVRARISECV